MQELYPWWELAKQFVREQIAQMEEHMAAQFDRLTKDVAATTAQVAALKTALATGLADIGAEIAALKTAAPDITPQLAELEQAVADLGTATGTIVAADPGSQTPPAPTPTPPATPPTA